jgi:hypothetical protein
MAQIVAPAFDAAQSPRRDAVSVFSLMHFYAAKPSSDAHARRRIDPDNYSAL